MQSGILRRSTDACFATLLPIFEDEMESPTFSHDRLEILSLAKLSNIYIIGIINKEQNIYSFPDLFQC